MPYYDLTSGAWVNEYPGAPGISRFAYASPLVSFERRRRCLRRSNLGWFEGGMGDLAGSKKKKKKKGIMGFLKSVGDVISAPFKAVRKMILGDPKAEAKKKTEADAKAKAAAAQQAALLQQVTQATAPLTVPQTTFTPTAYYTGGSSGGGGGGGVMPDAGGGTAEQPSALDRMVPGLPDAVGGIKTEYVVYGALGVLGLGLIAAIALRNKGSSTSKSKTGG